MKIKNIILVRYNEIQTEIWVGVAYFWPKLDSTQVPKYRVVGPDLQKSKMQYSRPCVCNLVPDL